MLKSLQISKRMGLKDLLRLFYLSLLMSVKERQTYSTFYISAFVFWSQSNLIKDSRALL